MKHRIRNRQIVFITVPRELTCTFESWERAPPQRKALRGQTASSELEPEEPEQDKRWRREENKINPAQEASLGCLRAASNKHHARALLICLGRLIATPDEARTADDRPWYQES